MTHCPDCNGPLHKTLRPRLVDSGHRVLRKQCPVCGQRFPSDQEEREHREAVKARKDQADRIDQWWKRLRGGYAEHEEEVEESNDNSWW